MDPMEIARDITVAIISNPNYKLGTGKKEATIFITVLREVTKVRVGKKVKGEKEEEPSIIPLSEKIFTIKDMRSKTTHLKAPVTM
jgi:hypothetical protein